MGVTVHATTRLTYEDYVLFPDNGMIHELIDGEHYMSPAPELYHQKLSRWIQFQLFEQVETKGLGQVINAPVDVQLSRFDVVQPDIVVVLRDRERILSPTKVIGPPDLVVEILSKGSGRRDATLKRNLYEKAGVPEYWLVDPWDHLVRRFLLSEGRYTEEGEYRDSIPYDRLPGVRVELATLW